MQRNNFKPYSPTFNSDPKNLDLRYEKILITFFDSLQF